MGQTTVDILLAMRADVQQLAAAQARVQAVRTEVTELWNAVRLGANLRIGAGLVEGIASIPGQLKAAVSAGIEHNAMLEDMAEGYRGVLGSAGAAAERVRELQQMAGRPFDLDSLAKADRTLQNFSGGALNSAGMMKSVGDAAADAHAPLDAVSDSVGKLYAALRTGESAKQVTQRLVELGVITLAQKVNFDAMSKSANSNAVAIEAITAALASHAGGMERQANTWKGLAATMQEGLKQLQGEVTKPLFDELKRSLAALNEELASGEFKEDLAEVGQHLATMAKYGLAVAEFLAKHAVQIGSIAGLYAAWKLAQKVGDLVNMAKATVSQEGATRRNIAAIESEVLARKAQQAQYQQILNLKRQLVTVEAQEALALQKTGAASIGAATAAELAAVNKQLGLTPGLAGAVGRALGGIKSALFSVGGVTTVAMLGVFAIQWWEDWRIAALKAIDAVRDAVSKDVHKTAREFQSSTSEDQTKGILDKQVEKVRALKKQIDELEAWGTFVPGYHPKDAEDAKIKRPESFEEAARHDKELARLKEEYAAQSGLLSAMNGAEENGSQRAREEANAAAKAVDELISSQQSAASSYESLAKAEYEKHVSAGQQIDDLGNQSAAIKAYADGAVADFAASHDAMVSGAQAAYDAEKAQIETLYAFETKKAGDNVDALKAAGEKRTSALAAAEGKYKAAVLETAVAYGKLSAQQQKEADEASKAKLDAAKAQIEEKKSVQELAAAQAKNAIEQIRHERELLELRTDLSPQEKEEKRIELIAAERAELKKLADGWAAYLAFLEKMPKVPGLNLGMDVEEVKGTIQALQAQLDNVGGGGKKPTYTKAQQSANDFNDLGDPTQHLQGLAEGHGFEGVQETFSVGILDYMTQIGTAADQVAATITNSIGTAVDGISDGIYGWLTGTKSWQDAMKEMGQSILKQMLQTIVQIGAQQLVNFLITKTGILSISALQTATRTQQDAQTKASGATNAVALAPGAAAAGISSFGLALIFGALALAVIAAAASGFAEGTGPFVYQGNSKPGIQSGPGGPKDDRILIRVSPRESILNAETTAALGPDWINYANAHPDAIPGFAAGGFLRFFFPTMHVTENDEGSDKWRNLFVPLAGLKHSEKHYPMQWEKSDAELAWERGAYSPEAGAGASSGSGSSASSGAQASPTIIVAYTPEDLARAVEGASGHDVYVVDTVRKNRRRII